MRAGVTLRELLDRRRAVARHFGITDVNPQPRSPQRLVDVAVIVETSGHPSSAALIEACAAPGATIVLVGGAVDISGRAVLTRELEVRAAKGGRGLYPEAVALVASGACGRPGVLVSHRWAARDVAHAFVAAADHPHEVMRGVIDLSQW